MLSLSIAALGGDIVLADDGHDGDLSILVKAGSYTSVDVTPDQLARLVPQLRDLETRVMPDGTPLMVSWGVGQANGYGPDLRPYSDLRNAGPLVYSANTATLSKSVDTNPLTINGQSFVGGQAFSQRTLVGKSGASIQWKPFAPGNSNYQYVKIAALTPNASLSVVLDPDTDTGWIVTLATDGQGHVTSTAAQVQAAFQVQSSGGDGGMVATVLANGSSVFDVTPGTYHLLGGIGDGFAVFISSDVAPLLTARVTNTQISMHVHASDLAGYATGALVLLNIQSNGAHVSVPFTVVS